MFFAQKLRGTLVVLAACLALFPLVGCQKDDPEKPNDSQIVSNDNDSVADDESGDETESTGESNESNGSDSSDESDESENQPDAPVFYNKLTGLETTEELASVRPLGIMINNLKQATPQQGISHADVIYEVLAEGGITRLFCLFTDYASLPETGSIRSSRDYYIDLTDAHDAIYVHCGGSPAAYETLAARKTENMDGIYFSIPFYRNAWRKKNMGMEHSMMTTGELLVKGLEEKGYRTTSDAVQPLSFRTEFAVPEGENVTDATSVAVKYSYYATSTFDYVEDLHHYIKGQFGEPHIDSNDDSQLAFENVLLLYAAQGQVKGDDKGRLYVNFYGTGDGVYFTGGKCESIKWSKESRTSSYTLYKEDGVTELLLNPGKTYIGIPPLDAETTVS